MNVCRKISTRVVRNIINYNIDNSKHDTIYGNIGVNRKNIITVPSHRHRRRGTWGGLDYDKHQR